MRNVSGVALALAAVTLLACEEHSQARLTEPDLTPANALALTPEVEAMLADANIEVLQPGPGEQGATGGAKQTVLIAPYTYHRQLAFSAIRHKDGTAKGAFEYREAGPQGEFRVHGQVSCLFILGNQAGFAGTVTQATDGTPAELTQSPGIVFDVQDNGEGQVLPDRFTEPGGTGLLISCSKFHSGNPIESGNIQVRP
jgi:hypothetical protein